MSDAQKRREKLFALLKSDVIRIKGKRVRLSSRKSGSEGQASSDRQAPHDDSRPDSKGKPTNRRSGNGTALNTTGQLLGNDRKRSAHGQTIDDIQCSDQIRSGTVGVGGVGGGTGGVRNKMPTKQSPHLEKAKKSRKPVVVEEDDSESDSGSKEVVGVSEVWSGGGAKKATGEREEKAEDDDEERDNDDNAASNRELILRSRTRTNRCDTPTI
jgi:hypothetical protein